MLVNRLRSAPLCEMCGGSGRTINPRVVERVRAHAEAVGPTLAALSLSHLAGDMVACTRCAGTGSPLRARVELAAYCGDEGAQAALGPRRHRPDCYVGPSEHVGDCGSWEWLPHRAFAAWVRGLQRWADLGRVPGWLPAFAAHAGFEVGLRGYQPGRAEAFEAAVETSRRMRAWLGDPGPHTLAFVRAAHDGAGPFASMPFPIRAMLSGVLQFEPGCGGVARQIDPDGLSSAGHVLGWSARNVGEAPVREAIQRSLIAWALSPGES